jgi:hypothetical protein
MNILQIKKGNILKNTTFCGKINGDGGVSLKMQLNTFVDKIYKKRSLESNSTLVLYVGRTLKVNILTVCSVNNVAIR